MLIINVGDPQPIDCPKCKSKEGYIYSDSLYTHYSSCHLSSGKYDRGFYSDFPKIINKSTKAYCYNCLTKLPFSLKRTDHEDVSSIEEI